MINSVMTLDKRVNLSRNVKRPDDILETDLLVGDGLDHTNGDGVHERYRIVRQGDALRRTIKVRTDNEGEDERPHGELSVPELDRNDTEDEHCD